MTILSDASRRGIIFRHVHIHTSIYSIHLYIFLSLPLSLSIHHKHDGTNTNTSYLIRLQASSSTQIPTHFSVSTAVVVAASRNIEKEEECSGSVVHIVRAVCIVFLCRPAQHIDIWHEFACTNSQRANWVLPERRVRDFLASDAHALCVVRHNTQHCRYTVVPLLCGIQCSI